MTTVASTERAGTEHRSGSVNGGTRANALADRLELGARALETFASTLTDTEWQTRLPGDGRRIGTVVHHVASVYPIEIQLAQTVAAGKPVTGVTIEVINQMNARHADENGAVTK